MVADVKHIGDVLKQTWVHNELPGLEELNQAFEFVIVAATCEGRLKDRDNLTFDVLDVVALHVLKDAVQDVHVGQSIFALGL